MQTYTIGKLAKLTDNKTDTLRYYEKEGLIASYRADNGYRKFAQDSLERLQFIKSAKGLGFSLTEIKTLLHLKEAEDATCQNVKQLALQKLQIIAEKITELNKIHAMLDTIANECCGGPEPVTHCSIIRSIDKGHH